MLIWSLCLWPFCSSLWYQQHFPRFFKALDGFFGAEDSCAKSSPAPGLTEIQDFYFPAIPRIGLIVPHISVGCRDGKSWVCGDKTRTVIVVWMGFRNPFQQLLENSSYYLFCISSCSSFGKSTLRAGTGTEDALCSSLDVSARATSPALAPFPTEFPEFPKNSSSATAPSSPRDIPSVCLDPSSPTEPSWGKDRQWAKQSWAGNSSWSCFPGKSNPTFSEAFSVLYTAFQYSTFPPEGSFLGTEIPRFQKPFLYFTQHSRIPHFHLGRDFHVKLLSWKLKSHFLRNHSCFYTTFQYSTFPAFLGNPPFVWSYFCILHNISGSHISSWAGISIWSCFSGKWNPIFSEAISVFHTAFQYYRSPSEAAFLGNEIPLSQN